MKTDKKFWDKIKQLGRERSLHEELQKYCTTNVDKIHTLLPKAILNTDGVEILNIVLNGIPDTTATVAKHKLKVIENVLKTLGKEMTSAVHCVQLISRICTELPKLSTANVVKICEQCIQSILSDSDINVTWKDVIPECMRILKEKETVITGCAEMPPAEYLKQVVNTIMHGKCTHSAQLAAMFREIQLEKPEHETVVAKLSSCMLEFSPEDLPPLVHQLLKLTKNEHMEIVLAYMSQYFNGRLYSKLDPPLQDSDGTNFEMEDFATNYTPAELTSCMCTCIYHAKELAPFVHKKITSTPKSLLITQPLLVRLALTLSELGPDFKETCIGLVKSAIQQQCLLEHRMKESAWLRSLVKTDADVTRLLKIIVAESASNPELITFGLINLAFALLSTSAMLGRDNLALQCWYYGKLIIVRLVRSQPVIASHVLKILADKMAGDAHMYNQCAELTQLLCKFAPLCLMEGMSQINALMESTIWGAGANMDGCANTVRHAARAGAASGRLRDVQILLCRKGLFHRDVRIRCNALAALVNVLKSLKVSSRGMTSLSENSSAHSYLTQISLQGTQLGTQMTSYVHNETVSLEVISMLRRCFKQDATVKQILYTEIHECVADKPVAIQISALQLLNEHFLKYYTEGFGDENDTTDIDNAAGGISFESCVQISGVNVVVIEPIGHLINVLGKFCVALTSEMDSEESTLSQGALHTGSDLKKKLQTLGRTFCNAHNADVTINEQSLQSRQKLLTTQQKLQCIEALIAFEVKSWDIASTESAAKVFNLYKTYNQIMENIKVTKSSKKSSKDTQKTQKSQRTQKDKEKAAPSVAGKEKSVSFKPLPCLWDLSVCAKLCDLLYGEDVVWVSLEQRNHIRGKREFHHFVHKCLRSCLTETKHSKENITDQCKNIAVILFRRCIMRFEDVCDFDEITAIDCLETFRDIILLIAKPHNHINVKQFLRDVTNQQDNDISECVSAILSALKTAFESHHDDEVNEDTVSKHISNALLSLVTSVYEKINPAPSKELSVILKWFEQLIRSKSKDYLSLLPTLLNANCSATIDLTLLTDVISALKEVLGCVTDEEDSDGNASETLPALTRTNALTVTVNVCVAICTRITHIDHAFTRIKNVTNSIAFVVQSDKERIAKQIRELERGVIVGLHLVVTSCTSLMECRVKVGSASQKILSTILKLYTALVALTKIIIKHTATDLYAIRFEKLLKVSGKKLSTALDNFITYVESAQCDETRGKVSAAQILRDTQLIPRVVCHAEQYYKQIIVMANKCKINYQQYLSHGTARDFRLNAAVMKEALSHQQQDVSIDEDEPDKENDLDVDNADNNIEDEIEAEDQQSNKRASSDESDIENISPNKKTKR